jgi:hypothetical protein
MIATWVGRARHHRSLQAAVVGTGLVMLALFLVTALGKASRPLGYDVHCFLATGAAVRTGANPYLLDLPIPYNYPLLPCTAAVPLTFLPEAVVHPAWFLATLAAWAGVLVLIVRRGILWNHDAAGGELILPLGAACLLLLGPIQNHLLNGQTDAFVLLLCVAFWIDREEGRGARAAFWLGLGVALKLVPALFFVSLLLRRSWSVLAASCAWALLLGVGVPALFLGADVVPIYAHYVRTVLLAELNTSAHSALYPHTYTVFGALVWLLPACKTWPMVRLGAAFIVLVPLAAGERWRGASTWRRMALLEAYLAAILLLAPMSQPHHLTLLLPSAWLLGLRWLAFPPRRGLSEAAELVPFALFPLWKVVGGPVEVLAVGWLFAGALSRATGLSEPKPLSSVEFVLPESPPCPISA